MTVPELSRPLPLDRIGAGVTRAVDANEAERAAVADRLGLPAIESLSASFDLSALNGRRVSSSGTLSARLTQECIVTGEPVAAVIDEGFRLRFVPAGEESDDLADPDSPDDVGYEGEAIDLGEVAVEQLALSLNPYPRAPEAVVPDLGGAAEVVPFAALANRGRKL